MSMKSMAATGAAGSLHIGVTRAHTRAYTSDKDHYVTSATLGFCENFDEWLNHRCVLYVDAFAGTTELFASWKVWAGEHACRVGSVKRFALAIAERGFDHHSTGKRRGYLGLALKGNDETATVPGNERHPDIPSRQDRPKPVLALDLGTTTGWALRGYDGLITSGTVSFKPSRFDGGGMRYLRFQNWLSEMDRLAGPLNAIYFEEVRRHAGTDAAHVYGGLMAVLTAWAEMRGVPYQGVPVGTIKKSATGKGNASKAMMVEAARKRGFFPQDDNEADAIAILLWALKTAGGLK